MRRIKPGLAIWVLGLSLGLSLGSCKQEEPPPIPAERMERILSDMHEAEVYSAMIPDSSQRWANKNLDSLYVFYQEIFAHHDLDPEEFEQAMAWYAARPVLLDSIYQRMIRRYAPESEQSGGGSETKGED